MIKKHIRETIISLHASGKPKRAIARILEIDIKTVRKILKDGALETRKPRKDKKQVDIELLKKLHDRCNGYAERIYEILTEEYGLDIGYSTVTGLLRENQIGSQTVKRSGKYPDIPGEEMQHDTTIYKIFIGGKMTKVVCSGLYLRYCKMRYIKFYFRFNRYKMKCFLHEALSFWGYTAKVCIIDNTNLAVYSGTGANAVFSEEMLRFARHFGFSWKAHRIGHANRKAGTERNFYTVETNFLPGRTFANMDDLNVQGFNWATKKWATRPLSKTRLIPVNLFEQEKPYLIKLHEYIQPPYLPHKRIIDQYGYIAFKGNYYWMPSESESKKPIKGQVDVIEYPDKIRIFQKNNHLIDYAIAGENMRNQKFVPDGMTGRLFEPKYIKKKCDEEEKRLRNMGQTVCEYLDFIKSGSCQIKQKPRFIRNLYYISKKLSPSLFLQSLERALKYQVDKIDGIERISIRLLKNGSVNFSIAFEPDDYQNRTTYQKGLFSKEVELDSYQKLIENDNSEG